MFPRIKYTLILKYLIKLAFSLIGYILLMIIKRHAFPSEIVFYEGIIIAFFYYTILYYKYFSIEKCLIGFLICLNFWALIPTIIDRSVSITVLGSLRSGPKTSNELKNLFIKKYVYENDAVAKRLLEQTSNGNVQIGANDKYILTTKGSFVSKVIEIFAVIFNVDKDFIKK